MPVIKRLRFALAGVLLFAAWQGATVHASYAGNWTALFCTGGWQRIPPSLLRGTFVFPGSAGYDGQMYRYVAHDPWLEREEHRYLDDAVLRMRRILVPGMAWFLALGWQPAIDYAYLASVWLFVFAGCYWTGLWCEDWGLRPWCALAFLLLPATLISMDRLTIDVATCALTAGFVWYRKVGADHRLYAILALACLSRETGAILLAAYLVESFAAREWKRAALFSTAVLPAVVWYSFLWLRGLRSTTATGLPDWFGVRMEFGPAIRMLHPVTYPFSEPLATVTQAVDSIALAGMIAGLGMAVFYGLRRWKEAPGAAALLFALSFGPVSMAEFWDTVYGYARPFSPMLLLVAFAGFTNFRRLWWMTLPCAVVDLRILMELFPQAMALGRLFLRVSA